MEIIIDKEFKSLLPTLNPEEFKNLEANIIIDGCRDPLVIWEGKNILLDGHHRYDICSRNGIMFKTTSLSFLDRKAARIWIRRNAIDKRNISVAWKLQLEEANKSELAEQGREKRKRTEGRPSKKLLSDADNSLSEIEPQHDTRQILADRVGVGTGTVARAEYLMKHEPEVWGEEVIQKNRAIDTVYREVKKEEKQQAREAQRKEAASKIETVDHPQIIVGDFYTNHYIIPHGSVSLIFTDPPYDKDSAKLFDSLAEFAAVKLCDGGSLISYVGHIGLPIALNAFSRHLRYWWTLACFHSGGNSLMREYGIRVRWKPMLWFVKTTRNDPNEIVFDLLSGGKEKEYHDWQQSVSEAQYWIQHLCPPDGIVVDPFLGSGTTAIAAKSLDRKWYGFEIDEDTAKIAMKRIQDDKTD